MRKTRIRKKNKEGFPIFLGCRPFSAEKEPLALSPGATNPLEGKPFHKGEGYLGDKR
jgi:hypothetical protein